MTTAPLLSFDLDRTYAAPPDRVWAAFTQADLFEPGLKTGWQWCLEGIATELGVA